MGPEGEWDRMQVKRRLKRVQNQSSSKEFRKWKSTASGTTKREFSTFLNSSVTWSRLKKVIHNRCEGRKDNDKQVPC